MRPQTSLVRLILTSLVLLAGCGLAWGQSFSRLLEEIRVTASGGQEFVQFSFSEPYQGIPEQEHDKGRFSLYFSGTGSKSPVRNFKVSDSDYISKIRVVQNRYSTTVTFYLKDPNLSLKDRVGFSGEKKLYRMALGVEPGKAPPVKPDATKARDLLVEMTDKITGEKPSESSTADQPGKKEPEEPLGLGRPTKAASEQSELGGFQGIDWLPAMLNMALFLILIVGGLYGILYLYKRFLGNRLGGMVGGNGIRQLASFHIGPKQRIVILEINGEIIACGVTATQISFLTRLEGGSGALEGRTRPKGPAKPPATPGQRQTPAKPAAGKPDPVQQFAEALKEKVGSMKKLK